MHAGYVGSEDCFRRVRYVTLKLGAVQVRLDPWSIGSDNGPVYSQYYIPEPLSGFMPCRFDHTGDLLQDLAAGLKRGGTALVCVICP